MEKTSSRGKKQEKTRKEKREEIRAYLSPFREKLIAYFSSLDGKNFCRKSWTHCEGGGGEIALLRGAVCEKAAVNISSVWGEAFPLDKSRGPYYAQGVSTIAHMHNPHLPALHLNLRYVEAGDDIWLGGCYDLNPMPFSYREDTEHFHRVAQSTLDRFSKDLYPRFSQDAKEYFYLPHRQKERGEGGIFFDHYHSGDWEADFALWKAIGDSFLPAIEPIYQRRIDQSFSSKDKEEQLIARGHYAEFNLLYDRGTRFGFASGGNPEAILCSLPPLVSW